MKTEELYNIYLENNVITTDSRKAQKNSIYFALKGERFDGNDFAIQAINDGCSFSVVDDETLPDHKQLIKVQNVLTTLQQLAEFHRNQLKIPVIAITGTNGKTTTKELINAVLSKKYKTSCTKGNLNNHIGVPITILSITKETEAAIVEMGANHPYEIDFLCNIAHPNFGLITNIGKAHLEGFGSFEGVVKTKSELYNYLKKNNHTAFIHSDNEILTSLDLPNNVYKYGVTEHCEVVGKIIETYPNVKLNWRKSVEKEFNSVNSNLPGKYNFENILAAISVGTFFDVDKQLINEAITEYQPDNNRSQIVNTQRNKLLLDAYNANPSSMYAAITNFCEQETENKLLILGDMFELGSYSTDEHKKIAELVKSKNVNCIFTGKYFHQVIGNNFLCFENVENLINWLKNNQIKGKFILIKASRGMRFERILEYL